MKKRILRFIISFLLFYSTIILVSCEGMNISGGDDKDILATPTNFHIESGEHCIVTFDEVKGADTYTLSIFSEETGYLIDNIVVNSGDEIDIQEGEYNAYLKASDSTKKYYTSLQTSRLSFVKEKESVTINTLKAPQNVTVDYDRDNKKVTINFDDDPSYVACTGFKVSFYLNGSLKQSYTINGSGSIIDISSFGFGTYAVQIKAETNYSGYNSSSYSVPVNFTVETSGIDVPVDDVELTGYYANANGKKGSQLESALRTILVNTHTSIRTYDNLKTDLQKTDADPNNSNNLILFYCQQSVKKTWDSGTTWNREHVWPNSKGVGKSGPGADCHMLRPSDPTINSSRGNNKIGYVKSGKTELMYKSTIHTGCYVGGGIFEPSDQIKGDVARIILYMLIRYETLYSYLSGVADLDTMLIWNAEDPVSQSEIRRNEAAYSIQGNRNPFIDHPELANLIWA